MRISHHDNGFENLLQIPRWADARVGIGGSAPRWGQWSTGWFGGSMVCKIFPLETWCCTKRSVAQGDTGPSRIISGSQAVIVGFLRLILIIITKSSFDDTWMMVHHNCFIIRCASNMLGEDCTWSPITRLTGIRDGHDDNLMLRCWALEDLEIDNCLQRMLIPQWYNPL